MTTQKLSRCCESIRSSVAAFFSRRYVQVSCIISYFLLMAIFRIFGKPFEGLFVVGAVLFALGAGYWFGTVGGLIAGCGGAILGTVDAWTMHHGIGVSILFWSFAYGICGVSIGYLSDARRKLQLQLKEVSFKDELTGCVSRVFSMQLLEREVTRAVRYQQDVSLILLDMDYFKYVDETYGYRDAREVLKQFSKVLSECVRSTDVVAKYGNDEFLLVLPDTTSRNAAGIARRIREKAGKARMPGANMQKDNAIVYAFSAGIAVLPYNADSSPSLMKAVQGALAEAKRQSHQAVFVEPRRWLRLIPPARLSVAIACAGTPGVPEVYFVPVSLLNVSARGMLISCRSDITGEDMIIHCKDADSGRVVECKGKLIYKKKTGEQEYRAGIFLTLVPADIKQQLQL